MVAKGQNIAAFIERLEIRRQPGRDRERQMLFAEKRRTSPEASQILRSRSGLSVRAGPARRNTISIRSRCGRTFPYTRVKQGILDTAATLFHLQFRQEQNVPAWDPSVETWDVIEGGKAIGRFYLDMHPRPGKYSHAEMTPVLDGIRGKQLPEATLVCNFPAPTATDPGLMEYSDVVTFFHEFGHLVHWIVGGQQPGRESVGSPWKATSWRRRRKCWKSGCGARRCWLRSRAIIRRAKPFRPIWWPG